MILSLLSMFIVIPFITDNAVLYGIYAICISTAVFLNYADLGFVSAGIKYAGESYAKNEQNTEIKFYGFSGFILFLFILVISVAYFCFFLNPGILIKDIGKSEYLSIASNLLLIQAIFSFNTVLQRYVSAVFQVRIEQFIFQKIQVLGSLIKLFSVFYFFGSGNYDIVGYYLFMKIIELFIIVIGIIIISKKYKLFFVDYIKAFKFDKQIFNKTKRLAYSSLFVTFMWVLYYELDLMFIGKFFGPSEVAVYALAFTFATLLRSLIAIVYSPFQNRYNHFVGLNDIKGLKVLLYKVILFSMPIFVIPIFTIVFLSDHIATTWAGNEYLQSGLIIALLSINYMYSFIRTPG